MSNADAFLDMTAECEGTAGPDGYRTLFGGGLFDNGYIDHPRIRFSFRQTDGGINYTTAAGRYQILATTWDRIAHKLWPTIAVPMFTPENQDAAAEELIAEAGGMPAVKSGDLQTAIDRCSPIWASLPSSKYPQPKRTYAFAQLAFTTAGGILA